MLLPVNWGSGSYNAIVKQCWGGETIYMSSEEWNREVERTSPCVLLWDKLGNSELSKKSVQADVWIALSQGKSHRCFSWQVSTDMLWCFGIFLSVLQPLDIVGSPIQGFSRWLRRLWNEKVIQWILAFSGCELPARSPQIWGFLLVAYINQLISVNSAWFVSGYK